MVRALHLAVLLAALSLLLPLAAMEDSCADCLSSPDCCAPSCCSCCVHAPALAGMAGAPESPAEAGLTGHAAEVPALPSEPRDVFHVPRPS
jgi:hypothetical protein